MEYIAFCMGTVTVVKCIRVFPNQKPFLTTDVRLLLNTAFKPGDKELYSAARANLRKGIRKAKSDYRKKMQDHLSNNNPQQVWQGLLQLTNFRGQTSTATHCSDALMEEINMFFSHFETTSQRPAFTLPLPQFIPSSKLLTVQGHNVAWIFNRVNPRKAAGPHSVPGKVFHPCLSEVIHHHSYTNKKNHPQLASLTTV